MHKFVEEVKPGHVAILKRGAQRGSIIAAGIVGNACGWVDDEREDGYFWSEIFGNVQGFNLQHGRYVTWHRPKDAIQIKGLPRGTLVHVHNSDVQRMAERIIKDTDPITPEKIPPPANSVKDEELVKHLIEHGLSSGQAEDVIRAFMRVRRLGGWYEDHWEERAEAGEDISEHETRTFLIVPLILALGWPEQRLKIEWNKIDIAFFETNYRPGDSPTMILESKKLYHPLLGAEKQAKEYAKKYPSCKKFVVSNGIRYLLFEEDKKEWTPKTYLNLLKLEDRHPYLVEIKGAPELLTQLLP